VRVVAAATTHMVFASSRWWLQEALFALIIFDELSVLIVSIDQLFIEFSILLAEILMINRLIALKIAAPATGCV
jgi:hypothetical protein